MHNSIHSLVSVLPITLYYTLLITELLCNRCMACRYTMSKPIKSDFSLLAHIATQVQDFNPEVRCTLKILWPQR